MIFLGKDAYNKVTSYNNCLIYISLKTNYIKANFGKALVSYVRRQVFLGHIKWGVCEEKAKKKVIGLISWMKPF